MTIDTTNICSHLKKKLFDENGVYHRLWLALQDDPELTAVVRSRLLLLSFSPVSNLFYRILNCINAADSRF